MELTFACCSVPRGAGDLPPSDDPKQAPEAFERLRPALAELLLLGLNALLGFRRLPVAGEKGGVPVHHHVPVQRHACSATSVSFK